MLIFCLILITIVIWMGIYFLYFRSQITFWFQNRFGKDAQAREKNAPSEPIVPFSYDPPPKDGGH